MTNIKCEQDRQKAKEFIAKLKRNPEHTINTHGFLGHSETSHVEVPDTKLLDNILKGGTKRGDTVFIDKKTQRKFIESALEAKSYEITRFARTAKPGETKIWYWQLFNDDGKMETLGHGFVGTRDQSGNGIDISKPIKAIMSNTGAIVIKKNPHAEDEWQLVTAFPVSRISPDIPESEREEAEITTIPDFDFAPVLHATESYQHASPIQRALLDYNNIDRKTMAAIPVQYVPRRNGREEQIVVPMPQGRYAGESVIITGDERAAASRTGSFPLPTVIERVTEHLMKKVNDQITQVETDRRARKLAAARDMQNITTVDIKTGPNPENSTPEIT